jgi:pyruvate dehydrogenase E1 component beta subunit
LLEEFGEARVRDTPISEQAIMGVAVGAAMTGLIPVVEIMFADFVTLAMDQLVNQAAKMRFMSGGQCTVPLVLRCANGAGTGAAAQHSQNIESWLCNVPGIKVVAPGTPEDAYGLLIAAIRDPNPVVFLEEKILYDEAASSPVSENADYTLGQARILRAGTDATIVTWGRMAGPCLEAAAGAAKQKHIDAEVLDLRTLAPLDRAAIIASAKKTGRVLIVHEAPVTGGFGGEAAAVVTESEAFYSLKAPIKRLGGMDAPVPFSRVLENAAIPDARQIQRTIEALCDF